jgi:hypothetical protein
MIAIHDKNYNEDHTHKIIVNCFITEYEYKIYYDNNIIKKYQIV